MSLEMELNHTSSDTAPSWVMPWREIALIAILALAVRLVWALLAPSLDPFLRQSPLLGDAASYDRITRSLMAGTGYTERPPELSAFWPPLYPAFLSLVYSVTGYSLVAARIVQAFLGIAVPVSFYLIALKPFGRRVAWLSAIGLIFYPHIVYFNTWLVAESLFMALMSVAMLLIGMASRGPRLLPIAASGVFFGLAALTKPFMLFVMPFLALWLFLAFHDRGYRWQITAVMVLALTTAAVIAPWTLRNYGLYGQLVPISTNGGYTFLGANNPNAWGGHDEGYPPPIRGLNLAEMEDAYYEEAIAWIRSNPQDFARLLVPKYQRLLSPLSVASFREDFQFPGATLVYVAYFAFLLAALLGGLRAWRQWRTIGFLYAPIAGVLISAGLFYGDARYTLPMVPSLVVFAAVLMSFAWSQVEPGKTGIG